MVPRRLIDIMMTRPSSDIYWLKGDDLKQLGQFSPEIEEYFIQKCGYDRNWQEKLAMANAHIAIPFDLEWIAIDRKIEEAITCWLDERDAMQKKGFEELKRGWTPSQPSL